jgi:Fe-S oxidoreductase
MEVWLFRLLVAAAAALFVRQMLTRYRLLARAPGALEAPELGPRLRAFVSEIVFQSRTIAARPVVGIAHLLVFWGFCAFAGYTTVEALRGLGVVDLTGTAGFHAYTMALVPFAIGVLGGIVLLAIRRGVLRPRALGAYVSKESMLISAFIAILMITFLVDAGGAHAGVAVAGVPLERINWWAHMLVILAFTVLIPDSKHLHLLLSPVTVFLRAPILGTVPKLDFEKEQTGTETVGQLDKKQVLDAFTCVECGRCQENCPAFATGKVLNPKKLILQNEEALLAGKLELPLKDLYDDPALWQCTTCGACQNECPVGIEHLPLIVNARRGLVSNGEAPSPLVPVYNHLERRGNIWGLLSEQRQKFVESAGVEIFDPVQHDYVVWLGCAGAFEADFQKSLRALFDILRAKGVRFGVLAREKCNGDVAKRTGNEYLFQELAASNVDDLKDAGVKKVITSCPHCLKTLGHDYREFGFEADVVHSAVFVESLTREAAAAVPAGAATGERVVYHDPCYLGRYAQTVDEPRALLARAGATVAEPERTKTNPFCCGAGGGLLFEEQETGQRISDARYQQLAATGADTVVMACPFCSIMLKGAQASAGKGVATPAATPAATPMIMTDLMSYVADRLPGVRDGAAPVTPTPAIEAGPSGEPAS